MSVVVTGIGVVSPLGCGIRTAWSALLNKKSGIVHLGNEYADLPSQVGGRVPVGSEEGQWDPTKWIEARAIRRTPLFSQYAIGATKMALEDAQYDPQTDHQRQRTGVAIGSGIGGIDAAYENSVAYANGGYRKVSPLFVPSLLSNMAAGHVSMVTGFRGPNHSVATACTTGAHALGDAANMIKLGMADVMVAGSTEAAIHPISVAGFARARSLASAFNDTPEKASRPFDKSRDGFVIGEGAAVLVLESEEHARARGARIYAKLRGYGMSGDAHHITAPHSEGRGAFECMRMAIELSSGVDPQRIGYVNAHATSTEVGDVIEAGAIARALNRDPQSIAVSSTKGASGHLLGAAGSLEAAFTVMALHDQRLPPTLNLEEVDERCAPLDFITETRDANDLEFALSNSFGFGGTNASLLFERSQ